MHEKNISKDRQKYLKQIKLKKFLILVTQIGIVIAFITIWEICANRGLIDSFITSQPSKILKTLMNLSENKLLTHLWVTCEETLIRLFIRSTNWNYYGNTFMVVRLF
jgi:NitT/TauT family transport system permease protein